MQVKASVASDESVASDASQCKSRQVRQVKASDESDESVASDESQGK